MRPEIQNIIDKKNMEYEAAQIVKENNEKQALLEQMGLFEKEYAPVEPNEYGYYTYTQEDCEMYPFIETNKNGKRYKKIFNEVTDEEYEALKNVAELIPENETENMPDKIRLKGYQSGLALFMVFLAVILYIAFFIIGIIMGNNNLLSSDFNFGTALVFWVAGIFTGTMMLGFAHIIDHLYKQTILLNKLCGKK